MFFHTVASGQAPYARTRPFIVSGQWCNLWNRGRKSTTKNIQEYKFVYTCLNNSKVSFFYLCQLQKLCAYTPAFALKKVIMNKIYLWLMHKLLTSIVALSINYVTWGIKFFIIYGLAKLPAVFKLWRALLRKGKTA